MHILGKVQPCPLRRCYVNMDGLLAIAIVPVYISKSGKKNPHIGTFWSGYASFM